jgi:hypothetical protein
MERHSDKRNGTRVGYRELSAESAQEILLPCWAWYIRRNYPKPFALLLLSVDASSSFPSRKRTHGKNVRTAFVGCQCPSFLDRQDISVEDKALLNVYWCSEIVPDSQKFTSITTALEKNLSTKYQIVLTLRTGQATFQPNNCNLIDTRGVRLNLREALASGHIRWRAATTYNPETDRKQMLELVNRHRLQDDFRKDVFYKPVEALEKDKQGSGRKRKNTTSVEEDPRITKCSKNESKSNSLYPLSLESETSDSLSPLSLSASSVSCSASSLSLSLSLSQSAVQSESSLLLNKRAEHDDHQMMTMDGDVAHTLLSLGDTEQQDSQVHNQQRKTSRRHFQRKKELKRFVCTACGLLMARPKWATRHPEVCKVSRQCEVVNFNKPEDASEVSSTVISVNKTHAFASAQGVSFREGVMGRRDAPPLFCAQTILFCAFCVVKMLTSPSQ